MKVVDGAYYLLAKEVQNWDYQLKKFILDVSLRRAVCVDAAEKLGVW